MKKGIVYEIQCRGCWVYIIMGSHVLAWQGGYMTGEQTRVYTKHLHRDNTSGHLLEWKDGNIIHKDMNKNVRRQYTFKCNKTVVPARRSHPKRITIKFNKFIVNLMNVIAVNKNPTNVFATVFLSVQQDHNSCKITANTTMPEIRS